jgi:hypothetical protein
VAENRSQQDGVVWILDTHLHIHPMHDTALLLKNLGHRLKEMKRGREGVLVGGVLAEMPGGSAWNILKKADFLGAEELQIEVVDETALRYTVDGEELYLFFGAQIVTSERIEVLAILAERPIQSGLSLRETIAAIEQSRGIVVLPWSPGKWLGRRGMLVREYLRERPNCWVGDIPMRWWGNWRTLRLRRGAAGSLRVLSGSDPLPIPGDEEIVGVLSSEVASRSLMDDSSSAMSQLLRITISDPASTVVQRGEHQHWLTAVARWCRVMGVHNELCKVLERFAKN